jgi:catechol O-methyltransferase
MGTDPDPFEPFGGEEDAISGTDSDHEAKSTALIMPPVVRDPGNGVLTHHDGTEQALLQFVVASLSDAESAAGSKPSAHAGDDYAEAIARCERILSLVDTFCRSRHWMMHVGDEKGKVVEEFLTKRLDKTGSTGTSDSDIKSDSFWILEIGTYCGYSTLRMAKTCLEHRQRTQQRGANSTVHIVTVDVSPQYNRVAKELVKLAGLEQYVNVSFVLLTPNGGGSDGDDDLASSIRRSVQDRTGCFDFCFIDHDKDLYLPDLLRLERARLIRAGTYVCADNIVFFRLDAYREHMADLAAREIVTTRLEMSRLEYVLDGSGEAFGREDLRDGLGTWASCLTFSHAPETDTCTFHPRADSFCTSLLRISRTHRVHPGSSHSIRVAREDECERTWNARYWTGDPRSLCCGAVMLYREGPNSLLPRPRLGEHILCVSALMPGFASTPRKLFILPFLNLTIVISNPDSK